MNQLFCLNMPVHLKMFNVYYLNYSVLDFNRHIDFKKWIIVE